MFLCLCVPRRLRLPREEPGSVHGSPLAAVLHCVVEAASLNRVYLREGGREEGVRGEMQLAAAAF